MQVINLQVIESSNAKMWQTIHPYQYLKNPSKLHTQNINKLWNSQKYTKCWWSNWPIQNSMWVSHVNITKFRIHHRSILKKQSKNLNLEETKTLKIQSRFQNLKFDKYHQFLPLANWKVRIPWTCEAKASIYRPWKWKRVTILSLSGVRRLDLQLKRLHQVGPSHALNHQFLKQSRPSIIETSPIKCAYPCVWIRG
jgi:hypothetical protein